MTAQSIGDSIEEFRLGHSRWDSNLGASWALMGDSMTIIADNSK
jgi:hypothetical protein